MMILKAWRFPQRVVNRIQQAFLAFQSDTYRNESEFMRDKIIPDGLAKAEREAEAKRKAPRPGRSSRYVATTSEATEASYRLYASPITPSLLLE